MPPAECRDDRVAILDEDSLLRRIPPLWWVPGQDGEPRPTSQSFRDEELSVVQAKAKADPCVVLNGHQGFALVRFRAGVPREHALRVCTDPLPDEPAHALVAGKKTGTITAALVKASEWVVPPEAAPRADAPDAAKPSPGAP